MLSFVLGIFAIFIFFSRAKRLGKRSYLWAVLGFLTAYLPALVLSAFTHVVTGDPTVLIWEAVVGFLLGLIAIKFVLDRYLPIESVEPEVIPED